MQGNLVLVRDSESSSYPGFELSRFKCTLLVIGGIRALLFFAQLYIRVS